MSDPGRPSVAASAVADVARRYAAVRARIASAGGSDVRVVAVTKAFGAWAVDAAASCGIADIGENYAQECEAKLLEASAAPLPRVHFIGRLQRNKVRRLAAWVDMWQTIDRPALIRELAKRSPQAQIMIQVNVTGARTQGGCPPSDAEALAAGAVGSGLRPVGLMTIGPQGQPDQSVRCFRTLRRLADALELPHCSMGMTEDLEAAVGEGATMVRIGRSLFGPRPAPSASP